VNRRGFLAATTVAVVALPLAGQAQQPTRAWRVGFLSGGGRTSDGAPPMSLRQALRDLGYVEQQNVVYFGRWADAKQERLPGLAAELIGIKVDVMGTFWARAAVRRVARVSKVPGMYGGQGRD
jgi:putative ABC transport system substrate-binding protein